MQFPHENHLRAERRAIVDTLDSLSDDEFESGPTLCEAWSPRDILAHVMGVDTSLFEYAKHPGKIGDANAVIVSKARSMSRERLMNRARHWAAKPAPLTRMSAAFFLGDNAIHHQDILRALGRTREVPAPMAAAILREGLVLGGFKKLVSHRIEPTDGGPAIGRGKVVRGTSEALGMWLAGRKGIEDDLEFA
jgi:uncharacterized protein (TIGR03083 family)